MQNVWKILTRQRRWWPPEWSFVAVIALSIILAAWPLADPQWTKKGAYLTTVIAMLIIGSALSARSRWLLEKRYSQQYGATLADLRARSWTLLAEVSAVVRRAREAWEKNEPPLDISAEYRPYLVPVLALLQELGHQNIMAPDTMRAVIEKGTMDSVEDVRIIAESLRYMDKELGKLYARVLSGD